MNAQILFRGLTIAALLAHCAAACAQSEPKPKSEPKKPASKLDEELLKQLGGELPDELGDKPAEKKPAAEKPSKEQPPAKKPAGDLDKELLEGLGEGEDIGQENPLLRLGRQMRKASDLIAETKSGRETQQLQDKIVTDLDELIKEAKKRQQNQQQSGKAGQQRGQRQQVAQAKPGQSGQGNPQDQPAKESTDRQGKNELRRPDLAGRGDAIKRVWGNLPDKLQRELMLQKPDDQFLPEYELMIEAYFKALVEKQQPKP